MGLSIVKVAAGGLPVTIATAGGLPCTEATNGYGIAVTQSPTGGGLAVTGFAFGPTVAITATSVLETAAVNTTVGTLSVSGSYTGTPVFTLSDSAGGKFNISGNLLRTNALLDYETATFHNVTVAVSGTTPATASRTITISVTDVLEPVIVLTGTTVNEDAAINTTVGTLSVVNTYTGTPVYSLTDSAGGKFNISGALLRVNAALDYETASTHNITAHVTGITPTAPDKVFTVVVLDITESGGAYQGPGDIKAGALGWWGLRAYSAAQCTGSVAAIQVVKASDGTAPTNINIKTDGSLDVAAISALGYAVKILKLYDQSGNGRHLEAMSVVSVADYALGPTLNLTGIGGTKPCMEFTNSIWSLRNTAGFGAVAQPWTISMIFNRTTNNSAYENYLGPLSTFGMYGNNAANGVLMYVGSGLPVATAADGAVHVGQFVFNNTTGFAYIDGVNTAMNVAATTGWPAGMINFGNNSAQAAVLSQRFEIGFWGLAFSPAEAAAMGTNQSNYLAGIGGGGGGLTKNIVTDYGAVADGQWEYLTLSIAASGTTLTSATPVWEAGDVGKAIAVGWIGQGHNSLATTIAGYVSPTVIILADTSWYALSVEPNIVVAWGTNNTTAFGAFRTEFEGDAVTLTIPPGTYAVVDGNFGGLWDGIRNITVNATGATICGGLFQVQASAQYGDTTHSARTASVSAGATSVMLTTPAQVSRFTPGRYAMMTGVDLMMYGYPTNQNVFEYLLVAAVDSDTGSPTYGRVTFSTPLNYSYLSTWPHYNATGLDYGGPATLYAMNPFFDHTCVINNLTIAQNQQWAMAGKSLTFNDCVFYGMPGNSGPHPTMAISIVMNDCVCEDGTMEVDKEITTFELNGCHWGGISIQSSSVDTLILDNTDIDFTVLGAVHTTIIRNGSTVGTLNPSTIYGYPNVLQVSNSVISNFGSETYHGSGHEIRSGDGTNDGIQTDWTIEDGVITVPASMRLLGGTSQWAVPGGRAYLYDPLVGTLKAFTITGVTQSAPGGDILVATTMTLDDWPARTYGSLGLWLYTHAAPVCTFTSVTGCPEAVDLSNAAAAGLPLYSYSKRSYTGSVAASPYWQMYGRVKKIVVTVTTAYTGATGSVVANLLLGNALINMTTFADTAWAPIIDLKKIGTRTFDATSGSYPVSWSSTAVAAADTLPAMSAALWAPGNYRMVMTDISAESSGTWPAFSVEVITDQGFPATMNGTPTAVTLSNGGLTATHNSTALGMAGVSNADGKTGGKYYFEALFTATHGASDCVTVSLTGSTIAGIISSGQLTTAVYAGTGNIWSNNVNTGKNLGVTVSGDIIGVAVDLGARLGWFRRYRGTAGNWNNDAAANPATGAGGVTMAPTLAAFPNVGFGGTGTAINDIITVNFGASAFAMPVPAGFVSGWPA